MEKKPITVSDKLFDAVLKLENIEECKAFFEDLCTIRELQDLTQRFEVACMLWEGKNYQEVSRLTALSAFTIKFPIKQTDIQTCSHQKNASISIRITQDGTFSLPFR